MRTDTATAISALPVLVSTSAVDQEGVVVPDNFVPPFHVRRMRASDLSKSFRRSFRNVEGQELRAEKEEFVAFVELIRAYKLRMNPSWKGERLKAWKEALRKYERSLVARKETSPLLEDKKKRREFGRQLIDIVAPACGIDLGTKSPKRAADLWDDYRLSRNTKSNPTLLLCQMFSKHLLGTRLVLWLSQNRLEPALYCESGRAAFYVEALLKLDERKGWEVCRYSGCKKIFKQSRPDQKCCSARHRDAYRMQVYRTTPRGRRAMQRDAERRKKRNALAPKKLA